MMGTGFFFQFHHSSSCVGKNDKFYQNIPGTVYKTFGSELQTKLKNSYFDMHMGYYFSSSVDKDDKFYNILDKSNRITDQTKRFLF